MKMWRVLGLFILLTIGMSAVAEDEDPAVAEEGGEAAVAAPPIYVPVKPAFVVNYGGPGKLKYMKLEISLRAKDTSASNAIRHHMPLIRDYLVREFSKLQDEDVDSQHGKEAVRVSALEGIQALLEEEDGEQGVTGLYFNNFVIQR
ncbi:MAG: flagellar basal body-associated FliL family protein [Pseudomonadota bacterium]